MKLMLTIATFAVTAFAFTSVTIASDKIGTGGEGGQYEAAGKVFVTQALKASKGKLVMEPENTTGSEANREGFNSKKFDVILSQADLEKPLNRPAKAINLYPETVFWVFNPKHGFKDLEDLEGNTEYRIAMVEGSGSFATLKSFVREDSGYEKNLKGVVAVDSVYEAFDAVASGELDGQKIAGTIYVGGKIPTELVEDFGNSVTIGRATDGDFNDAEDVNGNELYTNCDVTDAQANGMKTAGLFSPKTVCVWSQLIIAKDVSSDRSKWYTKAAVRTKSFMESKLLD